jgi:hypothetical protein
MYVRIARFEGGDPAEADQTIAAVKQMVESDTPEGLEGATRFVMLIDRQNGRGLGVTFFDDEEGMRRGHEALNAMNPTGAMNPEGTSGRRTSVEMYEVAIDAPL